MQTVTINFTVSGQTLTVTNPPIKIASNTVKYVKAVFALDSDWTGFDVASAIWYNDFAQIAVVLDENGECMIPHEVLAKPDDVMVNLVGRDIVNNELVDRLTTYPAKALDVDANAKITGTETAPVTPSQFEQYIAIVEQLVGSVKDIDRTELNSDYTLTIYYTDGTSDTVGPIRGATGATGNGVLSAVLNPDYTLTLNYTNGQHDTVGPIRGVQGETGNGIQSIYLTGTSGAVKTYTILFTDGNTTEFQVTDGEVTNAVLEQVLPTDTASGAIASFPDGSDLFSAKSLVAEINPIQDLHGYDSPWVGGGGVNMWIPFGGSSRGIDFVLQSDGTVKISGTMLTTGWPQITKGYTLAELGLAIGDTLYNYVPSDSDVTCAVRLFDSNDTQLLQIASNSSGTIPANTVTVRLVQIGKSGNTAPSQGDTINTIGKFELLKGSSAPTTWTPYSNICPISGWDSVGVVVGGFNLWDEEWELGKFDTTTGANTPSATQIRSKNYIQIKGGSTYYIKATPEVWCIFFDINKNAIPSGAGSTYNKSGNSVQLGNVKPTFTVPSNAVYMRFYTQNSYGTTYNNDISINYPSTDTSYHAYNGTTKTVTLPTTTYGGSVDIVSGKLLTCPYYASYNGETLTGEWISDRDKYVAGTTPTTGAQVVNIGGTKTESTITPTDVQILKATNNIFADSGNVSVTYKADTQLWVEKKLSEL